MKKVKKICLFKIIDISLHRKNAMARYLSWLERMIHNHEVPGSIPGLATETEKVEKLSPFFFLYCCHV